MQAEVIAWPHSFKGYTELFRKTGNHEIIFLQKKCPTYFPLRLLRYRAKRLIYDFDDALMYRDSNAASPHSRTRRMKFARIAKAADYIIAGNSFLYRQARRFNTRVDVVPTAIDSQKYTVKNYKNKERVITIGWIGSGSTLPYLEGIKPVFEELGTRYNNLRLKIICDRFFDCKNIPVVKKIWSAEEEIEDLKSLDVGVAPLSDDLWSRGKCSLKILQYYGVGVPVVCTPVGVNKDMVRDGVNGYWARSDKEWVEKLSLLIEDVGLRQRMGMKGRELVSRSFSLEHCAPRLYEVLKEVIL